MLHRWGTGISIQFMEALQPGPTNQRTHSPIHLAISFPHSVSFLQWPATQITVARWPLHQQRMLEAAVEAAAQPQRRVAHAAHLSAVLGSAEQLELVQATRIVARYHLISAGLRSESANLATVSVQSRFAGDLGVSPAALRSTALNVN